MKRILFVDDELDILEGLQDLLRKHRSKFEMVFAQGGARALDELQKAPFEVIVSDMRMPEMDGAELLHRVKEQHPDVVRIILSGHADRDAIFLAIPVTHQFLAKPCDANTLFNVIERTCRLRTLLSDESLRKLIGSIENLPSIPALYHELIAAMARPDVSTQNIAEIIEQDTAMSAKILQLANSACFGSTRHIARIHQAVVHLGMELVRNLTLTAHVFKQLADVPAMSGFSIEAIQEHGLITARVASRLLGDPQLAQGAFTAGLLHDIGSIVLAVCIPDRFRMILGVSQNSDRPSREMELESLGVTHAEAGAYLLGLWGLPYPIVEAVVYHHNPAAVSEMSFGISSAVSLADTLVDEAMAGRPGNIDMAYLDSLNVQSELTRWKAVAREEVERY